MTSLSDSVLRVACRGRKTFEANALGANPLERVPFERMLPRRKVTIEAADVVVVVTGGVGGGERCADVVVVDVQVMYS